MLKKARTSQGPMMSISKMTVTARFKDPREMLSLVMAEGSDTDELRTKSRGDFFAGAAKRMDQKGH